jgi:hypothetical protein
MIAGLESHVCVRSARTFSGGVEGHDLRVRGTGALVVALADDLSFGNDDTSYERIRAYRTATALGKRICAPEHGISDSDGRVGEQRHERNLPSSIQTVTVGSGITPDRPLSGFAGS